ncbi:MAG: oxygen-insensitive NADPH nitroreductase [Sporolactobacillus sp.]
MDNPVIRLLLAHRSIRKFTEQALTDAQVQLLVEAAQAASTSSYTQSYSIIGVDDPAIKQQLRDIAYHAPYVEHNGYFFVFIADQYRIQQIGEAYGQDTSALDSTQRLLVALEDATLAAQNMAIAAESLGLGICYIGSIQNDVAHAAELLGLPERTFPIFGLAVGYPAESPEQRPRLPLRAVFHKNKYQASDPQRALADYDRQVLDYYRLRSGGNNRAQSWTEQIAAGLHAPVREQLKSFLERQRLGRK